MSAATTEPSTGLYFLSRQVPANLAEAYKGGTEGHKYKQTTKLKIVLITWERNFYKRYKESSLF